MDVRILEYLLEVEACGNISRAADNIHISPSALNQDISRTEQELGTALFERRDKKWVPTQAGASYLKGAREMIRVRDETYRKIRNYAHHSGSAVRIAVCPQAVMVIGNRLLGELKDLLCGPELELQETDSAAARQYLLSDVADAAIISADTPPVHSLLEYRELYREELVLTVPEEYAWDGTEIDWNRLRKCPFIYPDDGMDLRAPTRRLLDAKGLYFDSIYKAGHIRGLRMMAEHGYGAALLPGRIAAGTTGCRLYSWDPPERYHVVMGIRRYDPDARLKKVILALQERLRS